MFDPAALNSAWVGPWPAARPGASSETNTHTGTTTTREVSLSMAASYRAPMDNLRASALRCSDEAGTTLLRAAHAVESVLAPKDDLAAADRRGRDEDRTIQSVGG